MAKAFVYVSRTARSNGAKRDFRSVPTEFGDRLYFGPCKRPMRPRMYAGDWVFGLSPSGRVPRRIVFAMEIAERITFAEAYARFPALRGPAGPIHVEPHPADGPFPLNAYKHIPGAAHPGDWVADLAAPALDAFFVSTQADGWMGRWMGSSGPEVDEEVVELLRGMAVYGERGRLADLNLDADIRNPIAFGRLFTGLHLETDAPDALRDLCAGRMAGVTLPKLAALPDRTTGSGACDRRGTRRERAPICR